MQLNDLKNLLLLLACAPMSGCPGTVADKPDINKPPTVSDVAVSTAQGLPVTFSLPGNDEDGDVLSWVIDTGPTHGDLSTANLPEVTYTPQPIFTGTDSVEFHASDGVSRSDSASVTIRVTPSGAYETLVDISIGDHSGTERTSWPVSGGIPLPKGRVTDVDTIGLLGLPSQTRVLSRWSDGSIKFVLVDFLTDLAAGADKEETLVIWEEPPSPPAGNSVIETNESISVDTGALKFSVSKQQFEFLSAVWVDLNQDGSYQESEQIVRPSSGQNHFTDLQGNDPDRPTDDYMGRNLLAGTSYPVANSTPTIAGGSKWFRPQGGGVETRVDVGDGDYQVSVVEDGPIRTVVRLEGSFGSGSDANRYTIWIHAFKGKRFVRIQHNFLFKGDPQNTNFRRIGLQLPLQFDAPPAFRSAGRPDSLQLESGDMAYLLSTGPDDVMHLVHNGFGLDWEAGVDGNIVSGLTKTAGWIDVTGATFGVTTSVRDMAFMYPKELSYQTDSKLLTAWLWPDHGDLVMDLRASSEADGMQGLSFTHDVFFYFHQANEADKAQVIAAGLDDVLQPYADPEWYGYRGTKAVGMIMPHDDVNFPKTEAFLAARTAFIERSMTEFGWLGLLNYGDIMWAYKYNESGSDLGTWGNADRPDDYGCWRRGNTMLSYRMFIQYLRTGEYHYWRAAEAHLRHVRDALVKHHNSTQPDWIGLGRRHSAYWGATDGRPGGVSMDGYGTNWLGLYLHWNLTGDWRTYDAFGSIRRAWNRFGDSDGVNQIAGSAYVGLKLLGSLPGYEACLAEADSLITRAVYHASHPDDIWRDCTWFLGYGLYLADVDDTTLKQAIQDWWSASGGGLDQYGLYWHRDALSAVYWSAEGNQAVQDAVYDDIIANGSTENMTGSQIEAMLDLYQNQGVSGLFQCDMLTLGQAAVPGYWRAKDDLIQLQWDEPLGMAVIDHHDR
jgi:hypothetical protein